MTENTNTLINNHLEMRIEAVLFASGTPILVSHLSEALNVPIKEIEIAINFLEQDLKNGRGIRLQRYAGKIQLTTSPEFSVDVENLLGLEANSRLSRAALEALAIIAYKQPITRPEIDSIRGVNSDGVLRSLLSKGLIEEIGRTEGPGRPIIYGVTSDFLQHFGLGSIEEMPELSFDEVIIEKKDSLLKD
jgi:segregation and condensation protein B